MPNSGRIFFSVLFLLCAISLFGFGKKEAPPATQIVQVTGTVRLVGSDLFPELVINGENAQWFVVAEEAAKLKDLQHRTVTVEAVETVKELKFASGRPAGTRRELRDIKIIAVQ